MGSRLLAIRWCCYLGEWQLANELLRLRQSCSTIVYIEHFDVLQLFVDMHIIDDSTSIDKVLDVI